MKDPKIVKWLPQTSVRLTVFLYAHISMNTIINIVANAMYRCGLKLNIFS